uniref:Retrovirus-related Pol polyprotein from transposon TNT 1-94-like beta-barrel domain-containing protein n=1 Tax=Cajanus cajan TaxID=3821 RepID=A0A151UGR0_CAJCA
MAGKQIFDKGHTWGLDSGASHHMTPLHSLFENLRSINAAFYITVPTGDRVVVDRMGTITLNNNIKLHVTYSAHNCVIQDQTTRRMIGLGDSCDGIYILKSTTMGSSLVAVHEDATNLWHARMVWVYLLKEKSETLNILMNFCNMI